MTPELSIVIGTYGPHRLVLRSLDAIAAHGGDVRSETIVVDDASPGNLADLVRRTHPWARVLRNERNLGFAATYNVGMAVATAPVVLALNDDAFPHAGALRALVDAFADPAVTIAGAKLLYLDGTLQHAGMVWWDSPVGLLSRHAFWHYAGDLADADVERDYPAVTGAAMAMRRSFVETTGGFDDRLFANGYEDLDLCMRAWALGGRVRYVPRAVFTHFEGASMGHDGSARNHVAFYTRWRGVAGSLPRYALPPLPRTCLRVPSQPPALPRAASELGHVLSMAHVPVVTSAAEPADVEIGIGTAARDVVYAAPVDAQDARRYAEMPAPRAWWVTSRAQRRLLVAAGIDGERVALLPLGIGFEALAVEPLPPPQPPVVATYVDASRSPHDLTAILRASLDARAAHPELRLVVLIEREHDDAVAFVRAAAAGVTGIEALPLGVTPVAGERRLGAGSFRGASAVVLAQPSDPFENATWSAAVCGVPIVRLGEPDEFFDPTTARCTDAAGLADAILAAIAEGPGPRTAEARAHLARAFPRLLAARRAGELLRALHGGIPSAAGAAMTAEAAATVVARGARIASALDEPPVPRLIVRWDSAAWLLEQRHAERLAAAVPADVIVCADLDDAGWAAAAVAAARAGGRRIALYPVRRSQADLVLAAVVRSAGDDAMRRGELLRAVARPDGRINGRTLSDLDEPAEPVRAAIAALLVAADVVIATPDAARTFAAFGDGRCAPVWVPPPAAAGDRADRAGVAVDMRYAYTDEAAFVAAAVDGLVAPEAFVTADGGDPGVLGTAAVVVAPRRWTMAALDQYRGAGAHVVLPSEGGDEPSPGVHHYQPADASSLRRAVEQASAAV